MTKRIHPSIREEAALLCAIAASSCSPGRPTIENNFQEVCDAIGVDCFADGEAADLARSTYWRIPKGADIESVRGNLVEAANGDLGREWWAEAESILRASWTPSSRGSK